MNQLDKDLRKAFIPEDPGPSFTRQVMARLAAGGEQYSGRTFRFTRPRWRRPAWLVAAGFLLGLSAGSALWLYRPAPAPPGPAAQLADHPGLRSPAAGGPAPASLSPEEGRALKEQVMKALRLTSRKLNEARTRVRDRSKV